MVTGFWGKKVGMTQVFVENSVMPVTVIDVANWYVTQVKTVDRDGYDAVQVALVKGKYVGQAFSPEWLKKLKKYFAIVREVKLSEPGTFKIGSVFSYHKDLNVADKVDVFGTSKGCGFAGVVRRHNFNGPPGSHGSTMGKRTGSIGSFATQGKVVKGKRMPGHMGLDKCMVASLPVVRVEQNAHMVLVKGAIPGKSGSLVFVRKA